MRAPDARSEAPADGASTLYAWYVVGILMLANVSSFVDRQIMALLVVPIQRDLNITDTQMGLLLGPAFALTYSLMGFPVGRMADVRSRRAIIGWGIATWSLMCALCGVARSWTQLFFARVGVGVGEAALSPPAYSLIADYFPPRRLSSAMSVFGTGIFIGAGLAYLIGGTVIEAVSGLAPWHLPIVGEVRSWQRVFIVVGIPGLAIAALMLTIREPARTQSLGAGGRAYPIPKVLAWFREHARAYAAHGLGFAAFSLVNYGTAFWFPAYFERVHGWSSGKIGLYMGGATIVFGTLGVLAGGRAADWWKRRGRVDANLRVAMIAALVSIVAAFPLYLSASERMVLVGLVITNVAAAFPWGAGAAAVQEMTPGPMRGQASALFLFLINVIGLAVGPTAVAMLTDNAFRDQALVGLSLLVVTLAGRAVSIALFGWGLRPYRRTVAATAAWCADQDSRAGDGAFTIG
ncbi:MAG TPA: MFS transporter [Gemmatimonadaceae bacterium]|nr:MFS transporter [Gemmatimonadaceae bacterium]